MNRVARGQTATLTATLGRLEDLAARLEACRTLQTLGRTAFYAQVTAVARAVAQLKGMRHLRTPPPYAAGVALTEARWDLGYQTTALCQAIEQEIQVRTATAHSPGRPRPWDLWGGVGVLGGVVALLERLLEPWRLTPWEPVPHALGAGLPAWTWVWERPTTPGAVAHTSATPDRRGDATQRLEVSHGQRSGDRRTGED